MYNLVEIHSPFKPSGYPSIITTHQYSWYNRLVQDI